MLRYGVSSEVAFVLAWERGRASILGDAECWPVGWGGQRWNRAVVAKGPQRIAETRWKTTWDAVADGEEMGEAKVG